VDGSSPSPAIEPHSKFPHPTNFEELRHGGHCSTSRCRASSDDAPRSRCPLRRSSSDNVRKAGISGIRQSERTPGRASSELSIRWPAMAARRRFEPWLLARDLLRRLVHHRSFSKRYVDRRRASSAAGERVATTWVAQLRVGDDAKWRVTPIDARIGVAIDWWPTQPEDILIDLLAMIAINRYEMATHDPSLCGLRVSPCRSSLNERQQLAARALRRKDLLLTLLITPTSVLQLYAFEATRGLKVWPPALLTTSRSEPCLAPCKVPCNGTS